MSNTPCKYYKYGEPVGIPLRRRIKKAWRNFYWSLRTALYTAYYTIVKDLTERPLIECAQEDSDVVMCFATPTEPFELDYELADEKEIE